MALAIDQLSLGAIGTNCYLVRQQPNAAEAVVIDPGAEPARIEARLAELGASCAAILLTHSHWDHWGALTELAAATGAPVWLPEGEVDVFARPDDFYGAYGIELAAYTGPSTALAGGETVEAAGVSFRVDAAPGHSPGHVTYWADGHLFGGDVLFERSVGRTDLPGGDWDTLLESIRRLADAYPPETEVHPGHGAATTLGAELAANPFLAELRA